MKKMIKRTSRRGLGLLLALLMIISTMPLAPAAADEGTQNVKIANGHDFTLYSCAFQLKNKADGSDANINGTYGGFDFYDGRIYGYDIQPGGSLYLVGLPNTVDVVCVNCMNGNTYENDTTLPTITTLTELRVTTIAPNPNYDHVGYTLKLVNARGELQDINGTYGGIRFENGRSVSGSSIQYQWLNGKYYFQIGGGLTFYGLPTGAYIMAESVGIWDPDSTCEFIALSFCPPDALLTTEGWDPEKDFYTVTWLDDDGTQLEKDENVAWGARPEYNSPMPTKAPTAEMEQNNQKYAFNGWTPELEPVTQDATYTATYQIKARGNHLVKYVVEGDDTHGTPTDAGRPPADAYYQEDVTVPVAPPLSTNKTVVEEKEWGRYEYQWVFSGWKAEVASGLAPSFIDDGSGNLSFVMPDQEVILRGVWKLKLLPNVYYDLDPEWLLGGAGVTPTPGDIPSGSCAAGAAYTIVDTVPTADGFTFKYWKRYDSSMDSYVFHSPGDFFTMPDWDQTLEAVWEEGSPAATGTLKIKKLAGPKPTNPNEKVDITADITWPSLPSPNSLRLTISRSLASNGADPEDFYYNPMVGNMDAIQWSADYKSMTIPGFDKYDSEGRQYYYSLSAGYEASIGYATYRTSVAPSYPNANADNYHFDVTITENGGGGPEDSGPGSGPVGPFGTPAFGPLKAPASGSGLRGPLRAPAAAGSVLPDAKFELKQGGTVIKSGTTGDGGELVLSEIPVGTYTLVETEAPTGYKVAGEVWTVTVANDGAVTVDPSADFDSATSTLTVYDAPDMHTVTYAFDGEYPSAAALPAEKQYQTGSTVALENGFEAVTENAPDGSSRTTWTFNGWNPEASLGVTNGQFTMPANDVTIKGSWTKKVEYRITFDVAFGTWSDDSTSRITEYAEAGTTISTLAPVGMKSTAAYAPLGWYGNANELVDLTGQTVSAPAGFVYKFQLKTFTVTWKNGDAELEKDENVAYDSQPSYDGVEPSKQATAQYRYTFIGWSSDPAATTGQKVSELPKVTADVTYYAIFAESENTFTVTWKNGDAELETDENVAYDSQPSYDGVEPSKQATAQYTYTFIGWSSDPAATTGQKVSELPKVTADVTYYAIFAESENTFTVTWKNGDAELEKDENVAYDSQPSYDGGAPTKQATAQYRYTFIGWSSDPDADSGVAESSLPKVTADATYYAIFAETVRQYNVTFVDYDDTVLKAETVYDYGTTVDNIVKPGDPSRRADAQYRYTFNGWDPQLEPVTRDIVYKATYTPPDSDPVQVFTDNHWGYIIGYPEDYETGKPTEDKDRWPVKPLRNISRSEVATVFFRMLTDEMRTENWTKEHNFNDVPAEKWCNNAVAVMSKMGIVKGYDDGGFHPDAPITRSEMATIAARFADMMNSTVTNSKIFTDVDGHWAQDSIERAASVGWVVGYTDGTFKPDIYITRAEFMTMVNRMLQREPETAADLRDDMIVWPDNQDKSAWYYLAVQEATNSHEYIRKSTLVPNQSFNFETWKKVLPMRDWSAFERIWSDANSAAPVGGDVI